MIEEPFRIAFKNANIHFALIHSIIVIIIGGTTYWFFTKGDTQNKKVEN